MNKLHRGDIMGNVENKRVISAETYAKINEVLESVKLLETRANTNADTADSKTVDAYVSTVNKILTEVTEASSEIQSCMNTAKEAATNASNSSISGEAYSHYTEALNAKNNAGIKSEVLNAAYNLAMEISRKTIGNVNLTDRLNSTIETIGTSKTNSDNYVSDTETYVSNAQNSYTGLREVEEPALINTVSEKVNNAKDAYESATSYASTAESKYTEASNASTSTAAIPYADEAATAAANAKTQAETASSIISDIEAIYDTITVVD